MRIFTKLLAAQLLVLLVAGNAWAQYQTDWERTSREGAESPRPTWFGTATERSIAYGVVGGNERLYVASRGDGVRLRVLDANTGADVDDVNINTTGIAGGDVPFNTVAVSDDGKIFVGNLAAAASEANPFRVYMWSDESAAPQEIITYAGPGRLADNLTVVGSVEDGTATIYAATGTNPNVLRWTMVADNGSYVFSQTPQVFESLASMNPWGTPAWAVGFEGGTDARFYAGGRSNTFVREYRADGTTAGFIQWTPGFNGNVGAAEFFEVDGHRFLTTYHPTLRRAAVMAVNTEVADGAFVNKFDSLFVALPVMGETVENTHGDIARRYNEDGSVTIFVLATTNGIGSYTTESFLPPPPPPAMPIADARMEELGTEITVEAIVTRTRGAFTYAQDATAGITFRQTSSAFRDSVNAGVIRPGTRVRVTGVSSEFRGLFQINQASAASNDMTSFEIISQNNAVVPVNVTLADLEQRGEDYEAMLVRVTDLAITTNDTEFAAARNYTVNDGSMESPGTVLRTPNASDTELVGRAIPSRTFTFTGVVGQFTTTEPDIGYQLMAVYNTDIVEDALVLGDPEWIITPGQRPWLLPAGNGMRSGAYNAATDHVLVASREPAMGVNVIHAGDGRRVGSLDVTGVGGGSGENYPLNEIAVTEDGQIFGANLHLTGGGVRIYRWADEGSAPMLVFDGVLGSGQSADRLGDALAVGGSGDDVRVYLSGTFNHRVYVFDWDGDALTQRGSLVVGEGRARLGISEVPGGESIWINGPGTALAEIDTETGDVVRQVPFSVLPSGFGDIAFFEHDGREYVLAGSGANEQNFFLVVDVTDAGSERVVYETPRLGIFENTFFTGFASFDSRRANIITGATNVAVASFSLAPYANQAPVAAQLLTPADAAQLRVEGEGATQFEVTWSEGSDPDGSTVLYNWQLSTTASFDELLVNHYAGTSTAFTTDFATLASILDGAGVAYEGSATLYHRVVTSDGDDQVTSDVRSVVLTRGTLTNIDDVYGLPTEFALHGNYPNPFNPTTNIRFDLPQAADVNVQVFDILGRQVMTLQQTGMQAGANQTISLDASRLASGTYLYRITVEMQGSTRVDTGKMMLVK